MNPLFDDLRKLAAEAAVVQKRAKALGLFANDRELLECPQCGLMEDVTAAGLLITCRASDLGHDTGLRFEELAARTFRCPACRHVVRETSQQRSAQRADGN